MERKSHEIFTHYRSKTSNYNKEDKTEVYKVLWNVIDAIDFTKLRSL